jgi:enoyl-CoA hydratase
MIETTNQDGILTLRLAHGKASALDLELCDALQKTLFDASQAPTVRAIILAGSGSIFSAGVDLFRVVDGDAEYTKRFLASLVRSALDLFSIQKPVVAAVNGHAIAGGCILAQACDYRIMATGKGRIGVPELLVGVPFPPAVLEILRFAVPAPHLTPLIFSGLTMVAEDALAKGLVDEVTDAESLETRAITVAKQLAALPADAFALAKRQLRDEAVHRAKRYAGEFDKLSIEMWTDEGTRQGIRDYLARTVKK